MSDPNERFRRLRPAQPGDLFAHFGVPLEPASPSEPARVLVANMCTRCRWFVIVGEAACPVCGTPARVEEQP